MFNAISRLFRAVGYLFTGRLSDAADALSHNPTVMSANYDRIIDEKRKRLLQYKDAIAAMIAQEESKKEKLRQLTEDVEKLEKLKSGAAAKAKQLVDRYAGDTTAVRADPEYARCQAAFKDFTSTLSEKQQRITEIETDLQSMVANVNGHKTQIQTLMRELDRLKEEKHDAVADVLSSTEEKQIADMMTGIANDKTSDELQRLRDLRHKASANARVSRELAGLDTARGETEFLEYAAASEADDEFDQLIGLAAKKDTPETAAPDYRVPEA